MTEFKPGLEGVVAFETEIAEPDREGGSLRYRGVDIEELVGQYRFEQVWGLLVDESFEPGLPAVEPYEGGGLTGNTPADLQSVTARSAREWGLEKLIDITDDEAREDLRRVSAQFISIAAQSARLADGNDDRIAPQVVAQGKTTAERFLLEWRGEADPEARSGDRHLLDLHLRARPQRFDLRRADHGVHGRRLRRGALVCGRRTLRPAPRRRAGPGAADARCGRRVGQSRGLCREPDREGRAADGLRPPRLPGRGSTRPPAQAHGQGARRAPVRGRRQARGGCARGAAEEVARPPTRDERRVLVGSRPRRRRRAAAARAGDVRLLAHRGLVGAHPRAEEAEPSGPAVGEVRRSRPPAGLVDPGA